MDCRVKPGNDSGGPRQHAQIAETIDLQQSARRAAAGGRVHLYRPSGNGELLIVVSGDRTYQVVVRSPFGHDDKAGMARVLNSFRISQPSRHWQGD